MRNSIPLDVVFQHTCALPACWLSLRELLRLGGASASLRALLGAYAAPWRGVAKQMLQEQPRAWLAQQLAIAGISRRRNKAGRMLALKATERARLRALPLASIVRGRARRANAALVAHEHAFRFDAVAKVSLYPPALCRACASFTRKLVWGGRCLACFQRDDGELSAGDCTALGLRAEHRCGIPYRAVYTGGFLRRRYSRRVLFAALAALPEPSRPSRRRDTVAVARTRSFTAFCAWIQRSSVGSTASC